MKLKRINKENISLLNNFIQNAGSSLNYFRYYNKRDFTVIKNHLVTYVIEENGNALAYGHLDKEGDLIWLGTCVIESAIGKGLGKKIMNALLSFAEMNSTKQIILSVDNINETARALYKSFGFVETEKKDTLSFFEWRTNSKTLALVSTLAFESKPIEEIIEIATKNNFAIEFSSGIPYRDGLEKIFTESPIKKTAHNYFPAPQKAYVLNLASANHKTRRKSIEHCIRGMILSWEVGAPFFSAHAGFCIDPKPEELGNKLWRTENIDRNFHWELFTDSIREILARTTELSTKFLIENNVLAKMNLYDNGFNPLFCVDTEEILKLYSEIKDNKFGFLLDTAHLKVSANTLRFNRDEAIEKLHSIINCIHHSDNLGEQDNNLSLKKDYWFLKHQNKFKDICHVLEVKKITIEEINFQLSILTN